MSVRRSHAIAAPAIVLAATGAAAGVITAGVVTRRRRRARAATPGVADVVRQLFETPWQGELDAIDGLVSLDYVGHDSAEPEPIRGPEGFRSALERYLVAFPGGALTLDEQLIEGERVATRWTCRGTHLGELAGIAPTGRDITVSGLTISRVVDGKVVEQWTTWDRHGLLVQLGAVSERTHA